MQHSPLWFVYILHCENGAFYTGITKDLSTRINKHLSGQGAKYTRANKPTHLVYVEGGHTKSSALKKEHFIKSIPRHEKQYLCRFINIAI